MACIIKPNFLAEIEFGKLFAMNSEIFHDMTQLKDFCMDMVYNWLSDPYYEKSYVAQVTLCFYFFESDSSA